MELERLPSRARTLFYLRSALSLVLFWLPAVGVASVVGLGFASAWVIGGLAVVVGLLLFLEAVWLPALAYAAWGWQVREHDLRVVRGVLIRRETSIPLGRIQHVDTRQGPLERLFGLSRLQVFTASGAGADASIPGLDRAIADALRDRLVAKANAERDDGV